MTSLIPVFMMFCSFLIICFIPTFPTVAIPAASIATPAAAFAPLAAPAIIAPSINDPPTAPTAAPAGISGQIATPDGAPLAGTVVQLNGSQTRRTITDTSGSYRFNDVETDGFYTVMPLRANYSFSPESRSFSQLGNMTEAAFTATPNSVVVGKSIDTPEFFVRQHYLDFL